MEFACCVSMDRKIRDFEISLATEVHGEYVTSEAE